MSEIAAERYAKALYAEASKQKNLEQVRAALIEMQAAKGLKAFFGNPVLTLEEQTNVLRGIFKDKVPALLLTFMEFIASKRRLNLMQDMAESFEQRYLKEHNEIIMRVVSAQELDADVKSKLIKQIGQLTGKKVTGEYKVDPSIIGGIRVWAAGKLYEYSFNNELQDYKRKALQNV
jgi:F-type H+-transporting ATPase subunit delta